VAEEENKREGNVDRKRNGRRRNCNKRRRKI
jgi:hypothetical protein